MTDRTAIILDTDIGSDIDDAVCLSYLLRQPRCEMVGITTVSGKDPRERASLADAVCRADGRAGIPIHSGAATRFDTGAVVQPEVPQAAILERYPHRKPADFAPNTAVQFLHDTISSRPGEITLLAIGPMTNLALLFALDPGIAGKLKSLVLMCGVFGPRSAWGPTEWNAKCDPLATKVVYRAHPGIHRSVGIDVTHQVVMPCAEAIDRFRALGGSLGVVADACDVWKSHSSHVTFHDPLAATVIFNERICGWVRGTVVVETASERLGGHTSLDRAEDGRHEVAMTVDTQVFFDEYFGVCGARQPS